MNEELLIKISADIADLKKNLKNAQEEVKDTASEGKKGFKAFSDAAKTAGKAVGTAMKAVGAAILAAGGALLGLGEATKEYQVAQAKLATAFETAGASAEQAKTTYNELQRVLGDSDVAVEAAGHLAQMTTNQEELAQWTNICQGVYATFGDSLPIEGLTEAANETAKVGTVTGSLADALNWAGISEDSFNEKLAKCNTEAEREKLIRETLNGVYDEAAQGYEKNAAAIIAENEASEKLTAAMAELGKVALPLMTALKTLAADLLTTISPFVSLIGEGLLGAFNGTAGASEQLAQGLSGILDTAIDLVTTALPTIIEVIADLIPMIIKTLVAALPALLTAIIDGVIQIINALTEMLPSIIAAIMEVIPQLIIALIEAIPLLLEAAIQLLMAIVDALPTIIAELIKALPNVIKTIIDAVIKAIPLLLDAAIQLLMAIVDAIPTIIDALIVALPDIINAIIDGVITALPMWIDACITFWLAIVDAIPTIIDVLVTELPNIIYTVISTLVQNIPKLISAAVQLFMGIITGLTQFIPKLVSNIPKIITSLVNGLKNGISKITQIGKDIIKGLWNGISDMASWIGNKIKGFGESVLGGIKNFFGIKSPSRVMRDQVGKYLAEGIGEGFMSEIEGVNRDIENSMKPLTAARNFTINGTIQAPIAVGANSSSFAQINGNTQSGEGTKQPIYLVVGKKVLGEVVVDSINDITRQTGNLPLVLA